MGRTAAMAIAVAMLMAPSVSSGQPTDDSRVRARPLALEAVERLKQKDFAGALDNAKRAEAVYHAPTHLSFIAQALEGLGHLAEALAVYEQLAGEPLPQGAPPAFEKARDAAKERIRELGARVPSLQIVVEGADEASIATAIDGRRIEQRSDQAFRIDAGEHRIVVSAPGKKEVERSVALAEGGAVTRVEIRLEPDAPASTTTLPDTTTSAGVPNRIPAFVAFGVGGAGLAVGVLFGALGMSKMSGLRDRCPNNECTSAEQSDIDTTKTFGTISTIGFVAGGVGAAAGIVLLLVAPKAGGASADTSGKARLYPTPTGVGGVF